MEPNTGETELGEDSSVAVDGRVEIPADAGRAHGKAVWALITVATLIMVLSAVNTWVENQLLDTDNWVETSALLLEDDELRGELAMFLVNELYTSVDVGEAIAERLPADLEGLGSPVAALLRDPLIETVDVVLQSPPVRQLWKGPVTARDTWWTVLLIVLLVVVGVEALRRTSLALEESTDDALTGS